ncbi:DUF1963 domain-containing protein [Virgisporangium aliadipatigenens]|nr:DUF1963 domain-containing protein [Virgisporangium aliadipatigenens]
MDKRERFRAAARDRGVPDEATDWWLRLARPRLELHRGGDGPVVGYFGGRPALPEGTPWPAGTIYLATIDLAAVPPGSHDLDLPPDGHLLFFAEGSIVPEHASVIYVPAGTPVLERDTPDAPYERIPLHGVQEWSIPAGRHESAIDIGESRYDEGVFADVECDVDTDDNCVAAIGGYGDESTGGGGAILESPHEVVVLAYLYLEVDLVRTDFEEVFVLVGYLMNRADLAARRFEKATFVSDFNG